MIRFHVAKMVRNRKCVHAASLHKLFAPVKLALIYTLSFDRGKQTTAMTYSSQQLYSAAIEADLSLNVSKTADCAYQPQNIPH